MGSKSETRQKPHDESESEEEEEEEQIQTVNIDPTKLTPLSPEVISKQVCNARHTISFTRSEVLTNSS